MLSFAEYLQLCEGVANPVMVKDKQTRELNYRLANAKTEEEAKLIVADFLVKYNVLFASVRRNFESKIKSEINKLAKQNQNQIKFLVDTKQLKSIVSKGYLRKKGLLEINDYVRGAVLFPDKEVADEFVQKFIRRNKSDVVGYEEKERGEDAKFGYYGSHHLDVEIDGIVCELQIMTKKLWNYKGAAHDIYNKTRDSGIVTKSDSARSKQIFDLGNRDRKQKQNKKRDKKRVPVYESTDDFELQYEQNVVDIVF